MNVLTDKVFIVENKYINHDAYGHSSGWLIHDESEATGLEVLAMACSESTMKQEEQCFDYRWKSGNRNPVPNYYELREMFLWWLGAAEKKDSWAWRENP